MPQYQPKPVESFYSTCLDKYPDNISLQLECISEELNEYNTNTAYGMDVFFLIFSAALMFIMQAGFAMLCAGSVRLKNVQNTMLKNLLDACGAAIGFYTLGFGLAYGGDFSDDGQQADDATSRTFVGNDNFFLINYDFFSFWLFQFAFAATSATIVAGTLAERCQMTAYICYSFVLTAFVYPVVVHAVWSNRGILSHLAQNPLFGVGMLDFAGSGVVHMTGGITALLATIVLGPRTGRFYDERTGELIASPQRIKGHSVALQVLGTFILWLGWYGFNPGSTFSISSQEKASTAALAGVCTTLSAASGCIVSLATSTYYNEKKTGEATFDVLHALNGVLSGLVSITAGCAFVEPWAALIIGVISAWIYLNGSRFLVMHQIDDAVDAIPVHLLNGLWGVLSVGIFANPDRVYNTYNIENVGGIVYSGLEGFKVLGAQVIGVAFIIGWVTLVMCPFFSILNYLGWFRSDPLEEIVGLDISYHGGSAYHMEWDALFPNKLGKQPSDNYSTDSRGETHSGVSHNHTGLSCIDSLE